MSLVEIPMQFGLDEEGHPRQMPKGGVLQTAENVRYGRTFYLKKSPGYALEEATDINSDEVTAECIRPRGDERVWFGSSNKALVTPPTADIHSTVFSIKGTEGAPRLFPQCRYTDIGGIRRVPVGRPNSESARASGIAYSLFGNCCAVAYIVNTTLFIRLYRIATTTGSVTAVLPEWEFLWEQEVASGVYYARLAKSAYQATYLMGAYTTTSNQINFIRLNLTAGIALSRFTAVGTPQTTNSTRHELDMFEALDTSISSAFAVVCWYDAEGAIIWRTLLTSGTLSGGANTGTVGAGELSICMARSTADDWYVWLTYHDGTDGYMVTYWSAGGSPTATPYTFSNEIDVMIGPAAGEGTATPASYNGVWAVSHNYINGNIAGLYYMHSPAITLYGRVNPSIYPESFVAASPPFCLGYDTYIWMCNRHVAADSGGILYNRDYVLARFEKPCPSTGSGEYARLEICARSCPGQAPDSVYNRTRPTTIGQTISASTAVWVCEPILGDATPATNWLLGTDAIVFTKAQLTDRMDYVEHEGVLFLTGGVPCEYDGETFHDCGYAHYPYIVSATPTGAGTMTGTFQYVVVLEWDDARGRTHLSSPSDPVEAVCSSDGYVTVDFRTLSLGFKSPAADERAHIYRTTDSGSVFYRVTSEEGIAATGTLNRTYNDNMTDATLITKARLYTQGERGGVSGQLPYMPPPAAKFIAKNKSRMLLGGLEDPSALQWSRLFFPGEPVGWSDNAAFKGRVSGTVTAVAALEDVWLVFTASSVLAIYGEGPDDLGVGSFTEPRTITGAIGCTDHRSVAEIHDGVLFRSADGQVYVVPRGAGQPQWLSRQIRETCADYPNTIACVYDQGKQLVIWHVQDSSGYDRRLVLDLRTKQWTTERWSNDTDQRTLDACMFGTEQAWLASDNGAFGIVRRETAGIYEAAAWTNSYLVSTVKLADIRPFGTGGRGRVRRAHFTMESNGSSGGVCTLSLTINGVTETTLSGTTTTEQAAGSIMERRMGLRLQQCNRVVIQMQDAYQAANNFAGVVFQSITLETTKQRGLARLNQYRSL